MLTTSDMLKVGFEKLYGLGFGHGVIIAAIAAIIVCGFGKTNRRLGAFLVVLWIAIGGVNLYLAHQNISKNVPKNYIFEGTELSADTYNTLKDAINRGDPINLNNFDSPK